MMGVLFKEGNSCAAAIAGRDRSASVRGAVGPSSRADARGSGQLKNASRSATYQDLYKPNYIPKQQSYAGSLDDQ